MNAAPKPWRLNRKLVSLTVACAVIAIGRWAFASIRLDQLEARQAAEVAASKASFAAQLATQQSESERTELNLQQAHESHLKDPGFRSGDTATALHKLEWNQRTQHDPNYAKTPMESTLLKMEKLGSDPTIAASQALHDVALLSAPKDSKVKVTPMGEGFEIKVAFKLSALSPNESGAVTKHHSAAALRDEVRQVSAQLTRQLFEYCGSRGIERVQLSCNRALRRAAIPSNAFDFEKRELLREAPVIMSSIYRLSVNGKEARAITGWRTASNRDVLQLFNVETDGLLNLSISTDFSLDKSTPTNNSTDDPDMPLEF